MLSTGLLLTCHGHGASLSSRSGLIVAGEVEERLITQRRANDSKTWVWCTWLGILKSIPPGIDVAEQSTSYLVPVCLSVLNARNRLTESLARNWPSSLPDPYWFSLSHGSSVSIGLEEQFVPHADVVVLGILEIRVGISSKEVGGGDYSGVAPIHPTSPGI